LSEQALIELRDVLRAPLVTVDKNNEGSEAGAQQRIRLAAGQRGQIVWRNNVGVLPDQNGTPVRFGLANDSAKVNKSVKSSDLIGITPIVYAGRTFGVFTAIECKKPGWKFKGTDREKGQHTFHNIVRSYGGIGAFCTSENDFQNAINNYTIG
jgi:hypothetical protein